MIKQRTKPSIRHKSVLSEDKEVVSQKRATSVSLQGMIRRFSTAQEDAFQLILDTMNNPDADLKDRLQCAKFFATHYPSLLKQADASLAARQTEALNAYRLRQAAREELAADDMSGEREYKGIKAISLDIPDNMEDD